MTARTIVALASGAGRAGLAVLRISGPEAEKAARALLGGKALPPPRQAKRRRFVDPRDGSLLDDGLVLWFPAPASFTGENVAEFHCHGGRAAIDGLLTALCATPGVYPAEPGEFSRQAFENGKLDLTQVEALADLIEAETEAQKRQALRQLDGELAKRFDAWRNDLLHALASFEAYIDFPDEPLPESLDRQVRQTIETLAGHMDAFLNDDHRGERVRDGVRIVVLGPPNAGKSSLVNALACREAAIVTATPGTTRDVVDVFLNLRGYPVVLSDTAGLRETTEDIEAEGVRRALARAEHSDLRLVVLDGARWPECDSQTLNLVNEHSLLVVNKADLLPDHQTLPGQAVSAVTGAGVEALRETLAAAVAERFKVGVAPVLTRHRHRVALEECRDALSRAAAMPDVELAAEDVRLAARALGRLTGRIVTDEVLDAIFQNFCIGK